MGKKKKKKSSRSYGRCPACKEFNILQKHHFLPRRFYGENPFFIRICRKCHERVEMLIPETNRLPACDYFEIAYCFIYRETPIKKGGIYDEVL